MPNKTQETAGCDRCLRPASEAGEIHEQVHATRGRMTKVHLCGPCQDYMEANWNRTVLGRNRAQAEMSAIAERLRMKGRAEPEPEPSILIIDEALPLHRLL